MATNGFVINATYRSRCFSAACAVGRALRDNWPYLLEATRNNSYNWYSLVKYLDSSCVSQFHNLPASDTVHSYTAYVRTSLGSVYQQFLGNSPSVQAAVDRVINAIVDWKDDTEIKQHLDGLNKAGRDRAIACVKRWGGVLAMERLKALRTAELIISENGDTAVTYTYLPAVNGPVWLAYGHPRGSLLSYLNLDFYFFHEYLSHIFPLWDDRLKDFSEGYLFKLAHWESVATSKTASRIVIRNHDFAQHAVTLGIQPGEEGRWERIEVIADWFREKECQKTFPKLLLELAAFQDPQTPNFGRQFVRDLGWIADSPDETAQETVLKAIQQFSGDLQAVAATMRQYTIETIQ